jgi:pimeloyl-ACP methyl ester carboxylesterase
VNLAAGRWSDCLFVVIPGIGGSVLERVQNGRGEIVWGALGTAVRSMFSPEALRVGPGDGIRAIGAISDWQVLDDLTVVHGYAGVVRMIANASGLKVDWGHPDARDHSAQVVVFPYDFRRSIEQSADELDAMITARLSALASSMGDREARVVIVAHSMGGLVARAWARRPDPSRWCRAIATLGTPHLGAPKALSFMQSGLNLGPIAIAPRLSEVIKEWQSTHELLPIYRMIDSGGTEKLRAIDLEVPWLNSKTTAKAHGLHTEIRTDWMALGSDAPMVVPMFGVGRPTIANATLRGGTLRFSKKSGGPDDLLGDGTVPRVAAVPHELDNPQGRAGQRFEIGAEHGRLPNWARLRDELTRIVTLGPSGVFLGDGDRMLAHDLEGTWPEGCPLPLEVRSFDEQAKSAVPTDPEHLSTMQVQATPANAEPGPWVNLFRHDDYWVGELPPMTSGLVDIRIRTSATQGQEPGTIDRVQIVSTDQIEKSDAAGGGE